MRARRIYTVTSADQWADDLARLKSIGVEFVDDVFEKPPARFPAQVVVVVSPDHNGDPVAERQDIYPHHALGLLSMLADHGMDPKVLRSTTPAKLEEVIIKLFAWLQALLVDRAVNEGKGAMTALDDWRESFKRIVLDGGFNEGAIGDLLKTLPPDQLKKLGPVDRADLIDL